MGAGHWGLAGVEGGGPTGAAPQGSAPQLGSQTLRQISHRPKTATETSPKPGGQRHGLILPCGESAEPGWTWGAPGKASPPLRFPSPTDALIYGINPCCPPIWPCTARPQFAPSSPLLCGGQSCEAGGWGGGGVCAPSPPGIPAPRDLGKTLAAASRNNESDHETEMKKHFG